MDEPLRVGEVVRLKSGGTTMIIGFIGRSATIEGIAARCDWHDKNGAPRSAEYPIDGLARVEEDGGKGLKAVTKEFENLKASLAPFRIGLLHGRLKSREKEEVMTAFRVNEVSVLLATSLIEVGVDVPNATVMLVENAEQFGLAQLHQLRGRIGRGAHESYCILISDARTGGAEERLQVLAETNDGFRIAEADLKFRGPGELLGREQSGLPRFRFGNLAEDLPLIRRARELAMQIAERSADREII